jgi:cytochrome c553
MNMKNTIIAVLALCLVSWLTPAVAKDDAAPSAKPPGIRIEMGKGHFNRDGKAFHYWDAEKEVPGTCARCHAAEGLPQYLRDGKAAPAAQVKNGFACSNCHVDMLTYARQPVGKVTFASGLTIDSGDNDVNLCISCHMGRESTNSVNKAIADKAIDTPDPKLAFIHIHYYPAGATLFGTQAKVAYEFADKVYAGRYNHPKKFNTCTSCHEAHGGEVKVEKCASCHEEDGGLPQEDARLLKKGMAELYAGIQQYARNVGGASIAFSPAAYPYWYADSNGNGKVDAEELKPANSYKAYTPRLVQATYNYTFLLRDPGAAYHNGRYAGQIVYDTLESLAASGKSGVQMKGKDRP